MPNIAIGCKEYLLGLPSSNSSGTGMDYMTCQNHFPVLWHYGFPFKTTSYCSYFALVHFLKDKSHTKEAYNKRVQQIYAVCQYSMLHNKLLNGSPNIHTHIYLHIKETNVKTDWLVSKRFFVFFLKHKSIDVHLKWSPIYIKH